MFVVEQILGGLNGLPGIRSSVAFEARSECGE
jgi:hypothetical protein